MNVLLRMYANRHDRRGLGDAVQFNIVLEHIKQNHPDWNLFVETTIGKDSCHAHLVERCYLVEEDNTPSGWDHQIDFKFDDPSHETSNWALQYNVPATKPTHTLVNLKIRPKPELYKYKIPVKESINRLAKKYLETLPNEKGIVLLHYEANSSPHNKNIDGHDIRRVCDALIANNYTVLIMDLKGRSPFPDQKQIFRLDRHNSIWENKGTGSAEMITALIQNVRLFVGVDSGPLHLAGATNTPSIGYWKNHHPVHFFDFAHNVTHLLPSSAKKFLRIHDKNRLEDFFNSNYKHIYYSNGTADAIIDAVCSELAIERDGCSGFRIPKVVPFSTITHGQWMPVKI